MAEPTDGHPYGECPLCGADIYKAGGSMKSDVCPDCLLPTLPKGNPRPPGEPTIRRLRGNGRVVPAGGGNRVIRKPYS